MTHYNVDDSTELKVGDFVFVSKDWAEIYHITEDHGIHTSRGWICRTELYKPEKPTKQSVKYKILCRERADDLEFLVQKYLDDGWELCGGVSGCLAVTPSGCDRREYCQAIYKKP